MHMIEDNKIKPEKKGMCSSEIHFLVISETPASITKKLIYQVLGNNC